MGPFTEHTAGALKMLVESEERRRRKRQGDKDFIKSSASEGNI